MKLQTLLATRFLLLSSPILLLLAPHVFSPIPALGQDDRQSEESQLFEDHLEAHKQLAEPILAEFRLNRMNGDIAALSALQNTLDHLIKETAQKLAPLATSKDAETALNAMRWILLNSNDLDLVGKISEQMAVSQIDPDEKLEIVRTMCKKRGTPKKGFLIYLRRMMQSKSNRDIQGYATVGLASYSLRCKRMQGDRSSPESKSPVAPDVEFDLIEIQRLLDLAEREFADVEYRNKTVGEWVKRERRNIKAHEFALKFQVGKVAPDIQGLDLDGVEFKLSDYRGKIVLLDFWGDW